MLKVTSGIYAITNTLTGSLYIGSSKNIEKRLGIHKVSLSKGTHVNRYLQNSVNKHGLDAFEFSVIYGVVCNSNTLLQYEKLFMLSEDPKKLYNIMCPLAFYSQSSNYQEFNERRTKSWLETVKKNGGLPKWSEDRKKHQSKAVSGDKNGFYGKKHKPETLGILRQKATERWQNPENRLKMSEIRKLYYGNPEARARVGEKSKGRKQPIEQNLKKSKMYSGGGNPNAKPILIDGTRYGSIKEACQALGLSKYKIKKLLKPNDYLERE